MKIESAALLAFLLAAAGTTTTTSAFSTVVSGTSKTAFVSSSRPVARATTTTTTVSKACQRSSSTTTSWFSSLSSCNCPACRNNIESSKHSIGCSCASCSSSGGRQTALFAAAAEGGDAEATATGGDEATPAAAAAVEVPKEVLDMDGVESDQEAHNVERPARRYISKKPTGGSNSNGKPLSEFKVGDTVKAQVKSFTTYGAFMDIGATTDGLLHISQVSTDFISDIKEVLQDGQEVEARILRIDEDKNQVSLSLLTEEEEQDQSAASRPQRSAGGGGGGGGSARRDDTAVVAEMMEKGWDPEQFVEGTVVSTPDFGAFVRIDVSQLNDEVEGEMDGLLHISALAVGRVDKVTSMVNIGDKVQVRVRGIADRKVSLTMISAEDEQAAAESGGRGGNSASEPMGNKDWQEALEKFQSKQPTFRNAPEVVDMRK